MNPTVGESMSRPTLPEADSLPLTVGPMPQQAALRFGAGRPRVRTIPAAGCESGPAAPVAPARHRALARATSAKCRGGLLYGKASRSPSAVGALSLYCRHDHRLHGSCCGIGCVAAFAAGSSSAAWSTALHSPRNFTKTPGAQSGPRCAIVATESATAHCSITETHRNLIN